MRKCCKAAFDDAFAIGLGLDCQPGLGTDAFYSFDEFMTAHRVGREVGRDEGAMWMAAYIALGTWAAGRDRVHRIARVVERHRGTFDDAEPDETSCLWCETTDHCPRHPSEDE